MTTRVKLDSLLQVGKGSAKGGKRSGVPYNFGKSSWHEGQRKIAQRTRISTRGNSESLVDTVIAVGRFGHKEAQCWFRQEYLKSNPPQDALQRDIP